MTAENGSLEEIRRQLDDLRSRAEERGLDLKTEIGDLERRLEDAHRDEMRSLSRYDRVQLARHQERPFTLDFIEILCTDWIELHGDRKYRDDPAIVGGWATLDGVRVKSFVAGASFLHASIAPGEVFSIARPSEASARMGPIEFDVDLAELGRRYGPLFAFKAPDMRAHGWAEVSGEGGRLVLSHAIHSLDGTTSEPTGE